MNASLYLTPHQRNPEHLIIYGVSEEKVWTFDCVRYNGAFVMKGLVILGFCSMHLTEYLAGLNKRIMLLNRGPTV